MKMFSVLSSFVAKDGVSPVFKTINTNASRFRQRMTFVASSIANRFDSFKRAIFNVHNAIRLFAVGLGLGMVTRAIDETARALDFLVKTSISIGIVTQSLKELTFVGERLGVSSETVVKGLQKLNRNMGELQVGTGTMFNAMKRLAPNLIATLQTVNSTEEAFYLLIEQIDKMPNTFQQTALAVSAFGRTGVDLLKMTKAGRKEIDALRTRYRMYAGVIDGQVSKVTQAYADAQENLKASIFGIRMAIVTKALPAISILIERLALWSAKNRELVSQKIGDMLISVANGIASLVDNIDNIKVSLRGFWQMAKTVLAMLLMLKGVAIFKALSIGLPILIKSVGALGVALKGAIVAGATAMGLLTLPLWKAGLIIGLIVAGVQHLMRNFKGLGAAGGVIYSVFSKIGDVLGSVLVGIINFIGDMFGKLLTFIVPLAKKVGDSFYKSGGGLVNDSKKVKNNLLGGANALIGALEQEDFRNTSQGALDRNRQGNLERLIAETYRRSIEVQLGLEITPTSGELHQNLVNFKSIKGARLATAITGQTAWTLDLGGQ